MSLFRLKKMPKPAMTNTDAPVKLDNTLAWDGHEQPFFERYTVVLRDAKANWALILRYSLSATTGEDHSGKAILRGFYFDETQPTMSLKSEFNLAEYDIIHADQFISIDQSFLSLADAIGEIVQEKESLKWEISFEDPVISLRPYPHRLYYHTKFYPFVSNAPRWIGFASGQFYANQIKREFKRIRIYQNHDYGLDLPSDWVRISANDFREDSEAYLEALIFHVQVGRFTIPVKLFCLAFEGKIIKANDWFHALFVNKCEYTSLSANLEFKKSEYRFECSVSRSEKNTASYHDLSASGQKREIQLSALAQIHIKIYRREKGQWKLYKTLTCPHSGFFESCV